MDPQIYYDKFLKKEGEGICSICGKSAKFRGFTQGYFQTCSKKCERKISVKKTYITKKNKYGDSKYNNSRKIRETNLEKYGFITPAKNENIQNKIKKTNLEKYGVENVYQSDLIKNKIKKVYKSKYGVDNPMQNIGVFQKQQSSSFKSFKYDGINYRGSYELDFLQKYKNLAILNAPSIKYSIDNKEFIYFPDFYLPRLNLIIEIKSTWILKKQGVKKVEIKKNATVKKGFNYLMILDKKYNEFEKLIK
jgi:hypothetical protein